MAIAERIRQVKRVLCSDSYLISNLDGICAGHNLGDFIFDMAMSHVAASVENCTLLQIGANTGQCKHDVFEAISRWRIASVLVEPQPDVYRQLCKNYAALDHVICENVAISEDEGECHLYRLSQLANAYHCEGKCYGTGIASFSREHALKYFYRTCTPEGLGADSDSLIESIAVPCLSFQSLMVRNELDDVDILLIDTEGYDGELLRQYGERLRRCRLVKFEHKHLSERDRIAAWELLRVMGFKLFPIQASGDTVALRVWA